MSKPTKEEYEKACKDVRDMSDWIRHGRDKIDRLLDTICEEKASVKIYQEVYDKAKETKLRYEAFQELENNDN